MSVLNDKDVKKIKMVRIHELPSGAEIAVKSTHCTTLLFSISAEERYKSIVEEVIPIRKGVIKIVTRYYIR